LLPLAVQTSPPESDVWPAARITGQLVLDDRGCVQLDSTEWDGVTRVRWPHGTTAVLSAGRIEVMDSTGKIWAQSGETFAGGGGFGLPEAATGDLCAPAGEQLFYLSPFSDVPE
jgi:hypothetical protein